MEEKPERKRPLVRPRCKWLDNIKNDLQEVGYEGTDWIDVSEDRASWLSFVDSLMNI